MALEEASEVYMVGLFEDTPSASRSCPRTSSWLGASMANVLKLDEAK